MFQDGLTEIMLYFIPRSRVVSALFLDMESITPTLHQGNILCCKCGTPIQPNPANMCVACIQTEVDITEGIPKQAVVYFCKSCERYLNPPDKWIVCTLESKELLALCLKRLKGLNRVRLIEAVFVWTEPHSRRLKLKLTIQKEVLGGAVLQQVFVVEYQVNTQMCTDCHRTEAKDFWRAVVQVRQKATHKKTLFYLEQLILRYNAHASTVSIKAVTGGMDFFFDSKQDARKMVVFLQSVVPCRYITSQQLISHDTHCNTYNYKHTFAVEVAPICKDDVVCLPSKLAHSLGGMAQICICTRITEHIHLIDPFSSQIAEVSSQMYWRDPFGSLCTTKHLQEYVVMNTELLLDSEKRKFSGQGAMSQKHVMADAWVVKSAELGLDESTTHCRTHLGHLLNPGDTSLCFDMENANINDANFEKFKGSVPDVVIVRKLFATKETRIRKRKWKLRRLEAIVEDAGSSDVDRDYTDFLDDLEEDPNLRQNVHIYRDRDKVAVDADDTDDDECPKISLQEMLEDLHLDDAEMEDASDMQ